MIPNRNLRVRVFLSSAGFTLIELLVATAVMALMLVMTLGVINGVLQSTRMVGNQIDASGSARRALDLLSSDLRDSVRGPDSALLVNSNGLAFLTHARGPRGSANHRFLAVRYEGGSNLTRSHGSLARDHTNTSGSLNTPVTSTTNASVILDDLLGFSAQVVLADGSLASISTAPSTWATNRFPTNGFGALTTSNWFAAPPASVQALRVTIAATDTQTANAFSASLDTVRELLSDPGTNAAKSTWQGALDVSALPLPLRQAIQIRETTISLP